MKINKISTHMLYEHCSFVYAEREFSKANALDLSFISYSFQDGLI